MRYLRGQIQDFKKEGALESKHPLPIIIPSQCSFTIKQGAHAPVPYAWICLCLVHEFCQDFEILGTYEHTDTTTNLITPHAQGNQTG